MTTPNVNSDGDELSALRNALLLQKLKELCPDPAAELADIEFELTRRRLLSSLRDFVEYFWTVVEPDQKLSWNWHLDELCDALDRQERGDADYAKLVFNVPPGTMKSLLLLFRRARLWARNPSLRFLLASYGSHLSERDNTKLRTLVQSAKYRALFPHVVLVKDSVQRLDTTAGGWSIATSVGGVGTGEHPNYVDIDDPITEQQSRSKADRESANTWIDRTLSTRGVVLDVRVTLIMQRLHEEDPAGHVRKKGGWKFIVFRMRFDPAKPEPRDRRTKKNELLWPSLFTPKKVHDLEIALGPYGTAGQLQQEPAPEGGGFFKREYFTIVPASAVPVSRNRVRGWDTGGGNSIDADRTCGVRMSEICIREPRGDDPGLFHYYVEHVIVEITKDNGSLIHETAKADGKAVSIREEKEPGSAGLTVVRQRASLLRGFDYEEVTVTGDKMTRAKPFRSQCHAGNVFLVEGPWNEEYLDELTHFPTAEHDDLVDGSSCAFNALTTERRADWVVV